MDSGRWIPVETIGSINSESLFTLARIIVILHFKSLRSMSTCQQDNGSLNNLVSPRLCTFAAGQMGPWFYYPFLHKTSIRFAIHFPAATWENPFGWKLFLILSIFLPCALYSVRIVVCHVQELRKCIRMCWMNISCSASAKSIYYVTASSKLCQLYIRQQFALKFWQFGSIKLS